MGEIERDGFSAREMYLMREAMNAATHYQSLEQWLDETISDGGHYVAQHLAYDAERLYGQAARAQHPDDEAVNRFAQAMKAKLAKKRSEGRGGWEDERVCPPGMLQQMLLDHLPKGDPLDIGNFAMMIWNRGESVAGQPTQQGSVPEEVIRAAAEKFLQWKLPANFYPDGGVSFDRAYEYDSPHWPVGTNILTAEQAEQMFRECFGLEQSK